MAHAKQHGSHALLKILRIKVIGKDIEAVGVGGSAPWVGLKTKHMDLSRIRSSRSSTSWTEVGLAEANRMGHLGINFMRHEGRDFAYQYLVPQSQCVRNDIRHLPAHAFVDDCGNQVQPTLQQHKARPLYA